MILRFLILVRVIKKNNINFLCLKIKFYKDGSYTDRYFQINSKDFKNIIFYLDYLDKDLPERLDENIVLFRLKKTSVLIGIFSFIMYFFKIL